MNFTYFPIFDRILAILNNILNFLLKFVLVISGFFIIYLGIKFYFSAKNFGETKKALIFILVGLALIGLIFLNKEIILKTIEYFVPSFK